MTVRPDDPRVGPLARFLSFAQGYSAETATEWARKYLTAADLADPLRCWDNRDGLAVEVGETSRGYKIYRESNGAGGHRYWSDAIGGGVVIHDSCLASEEEVLLCLELDRQLTEGRLNDD